MRGSLAVNCCDPPDRVARSFRGRLDAVPRAEWYRREPGERSDHLERSPAPAVEDEAARFRLVEPHRRRFAHFRHLLFGLRHRRDGLRPDLIGSNAIFSALIVQTGGILWQRKVDAELPEDDFSGYLTEHGYASNTPTSDGQHVYVFFGKSGVFAFDMEGKRVWSVGVGKESSNRRWGSGTSLILSHRRAHRECVRGKQLDPRPRQGDRPASFGRPKPTCSSFATARRLSSPRRAGKRDLVVSVPGRSVGARSRSRQAPLAQWRRRLTGNVCPAQ